MPLHRISSRAIDETITGNKNHTGQLRHNGIGVAKLDSSTPDLKIIDEAGNEFDLFAAVAGVEWDLTPDTVLDRTGVAQIL